MGSLMLRILTSTTLSVSPTSVTLRGTAHHPFRRVHLLFFSRLSFKTQLRCDHLLPGFIPGSSYPSPAPAST